jgi:ubiquinone/menaquinone biosynthesis C-methylase UbiE
MFSESARFYDAIYSYKDYAAEAAWMAALLKRYQRSAGRDLLDVASGTGEHLVHLRQHYHVQGLDLDEGMLAVARAKLPGVPFYLGDMLDFELGRSFDAVACLFSAIGYVRTVDRLAQAVATMARHVRPGGVLAIEPWFSPSQWQPGGIHALLVDQPELKVARMNRSEPAVDGLSVLEFHYLVGDDSGVRHLTERHELGLFEQEEYRTAFEQTGLTPHFDPDGPSGRGLFFAVRQETA